MTFFYLILFTVSGAAYASPETKYSTRELCEAEGKVLVARHRFEAFLCVPDLPEEKA